MKESTRNSESKPIGLDEAFHALSNRRRRRLLVGLLDHNSQPYRVTGEAANETTDSGADTVLYQTVMYHNHLPKLESGGYIDWNKDTQEITKGPQFANIRPLLELIDDHASEIPGEWP